LFLFLERFLIYKQLKQYLMKGILTVIGIILIIAWIFGFVVYHVAGFLIHLLLIVGLIMIIANLFKGKESS